MPRFAASIFACAICVLLLASANAQNTMPILPQIGSGPEVRDRGPEPALQSDLLSVKATKPRLMQTKASYLMGHEVRGTFRMVFRVISNGGDLPFVTIGYGGFRADYVLDWQAISANGARCNLVRGNLAGVDVYSGGTIGAADSVRSLLRKNGAGSVATTARSVLIAADFDCDQPVEAGDTVSVQIKFYVLSPNGWRRATYSFDDEQIG